MPATDMGNGAVTLTNQRLKQLSAVDCRPDTTDISESLYCRTTGRAW